MADEEQDEQTKDQTPDDQTVDQDDSQDSDDNSNLDLSLAAIAQQQKIKQDQQPNNPRADSVAQYEAFQKKLLQKAQNEANTPDTSADRLADAQKSGNKQHMYANMLRGFQQALQGASRNNMKADDSVANSIDKEADNAQSNALNIQKLQEQAKINGAKLDQFQLNVLKSNIDLQDDKQNHDPTSQQSKLAQDRYIQLQEMAGHPLSEEDMAGIRNVSGADLVKYNPDLQKDVAGITKQKIILESLASRERIAKLGAATKKDIATDNNQTKSDIADKNIAGKKTAQDTKTDTDVGKQLESMRGQAGVIQAEKDLLATNKVNALFKDYPDLDEIPDAQVNVVISEIAKIAQGGVPTGHEMDSLKPNTPESKLTKLWGQLTNEPTSANLGAYLKEFQKYNSSLQKVAQDTITDRYGRILRTNKDKLTPERYKKYESEYINRFQPKEESSSDTTSTGPYGDTTERNGKQYKWNPMAKKYQLIGQ